MPSTNPVFDQLESIIGDNRREWHKAKTRSLVCYALATTPLVLLIVAAYFPSVRQTNWTGTVLIMAAVILAFIIWRIGSHFSRLIERHQLRIHFLQDLMLYFKSIPEEKWPAQDLIQVVLSGRLGWLGPEFSQRVQNEKSSSESESNSVKTE